LDNLVVNFDGIDNCTVKVEHDCFDYQFFTGQKRFGAGDVPRRYIHIQVTILAKKLFSNFFENRQ